jgi:hypothetical protein
MVDKELLTVVGATNRLIYKLNKPEKTRR